MRVIIAKNNNKVPVVKCNHRFGAKATFSHQTDSRFQTSIYGAELYGFKNNVRLGAFVTNLLGQYVEGIKDVERSGLMRHDIYYGTDYWENPVNGNIELIPDYFGTVWTSLGATYFNVNAGDSKNSRFPNHGQQMFDVSGGLYGHDLINGVKGLSNHREMIGVIEKQRNWLKTLTGRDISCGSYRNGANQGYIEHLTQWIGMRNSVPSPTKPFRDGGNTFYGFDENGIALGSPANAQFTRQYFINFPNTFRWWDSWNSSGFPKQDATDWSIQMMQDCFQSGGWYKDFCHWHSCRANNTMTSIDEFLQIFNSVRGDDFIWTCSKGEAIEYLFIRQLTNKVYAFENNGKVSVIADIIDVFKGSFFLGVELDTVLSCINIPLSVEVDLSGTSLSGKTLKPLYGKMISKGNDVYIVELKFDHKEGFIANLIEEGDNGIYEEGIPVATYSISNNVLTVNSDIKTKAVLYSVTTGGFEFDSLPYDRSNEFQNEHIFYIQSGFDYRIGLISELGQSSLTLVS